MLGPHDERGHRLRRGAFLRQVLGGANNIQRRRGNMTKKADANQHAASAEVKTAPQAPHQTETKRPPKKPSTSDSFFRVGGRLRQLALRWLREVRRQPSQTLGSHRFQAAYKMVLRPRAVPAAWGDLGPVGHLGLQGGWLAAQRGARCAWLDFLPPRIGMADGREQEQTWRFPLLPRRNWPVACACEGERQ